MRDNTWQKFQIYAYNGEIDALKDELATVKKENASLENMLKHANTLIADLRELAEFHGAVPCKKCGAYHLTTHRCYRCGFDGTQESGEDK